jgi:hypothetical protein
LHRGGQVLLGQGAAQPAVGDDVIELGHHLSLGHHRQPGQVPGVEPAQIQPAQAAGVERGILGRIRQQHSQPRPLMAGQVSGVPAKSRGVLGKTPSQLSGRSG